MVAVYIREHEQLEGQLLGHFTPSDLYQLRNLFKSFDTHVWDDPDTIGPCIFVSAQFITNETGAFFEIIVADQTPLQEVQIE